jgi:hypothetical protein
MDELCKVSMCTTGKMSFFDEEGNMTDPIDGYILEVFVPTERRADIDRNDELRREVTDKIDTAITSIGG